MAWIEVAQLEELAEGQRKLCDVGGQRVALVRQQGEVIAIENRCPHRGGPVGAGPLEGSKLTCPWHGLAFGLEDGVCVSQPTLCLTKYPTRILGGAIEVDTTHAPILSPAIHRYLVRYGSPGYVGRFGSIERIACARGDKVLVATDRGLELGEVLVLPEQFDPADERHPAGEVVRQQVDDERPAYDHQRVAQLRSAAEQYLASHRCVVLDAESTFDGQTFIVYHAGEASVALGPLAASLAAELGVPRVQFETVQADATRKVASAAPGPNNPGKEDDEMRGPYERLKYDFRRVWECPVCHHRERTAGSVTSHFCNCQAKEPVTRQLPMRLIEDGPRRTDGKVLPQRKSTLP